MSNYYELLKDPRWQKKRLEVLDGAEWRCEECGGENETLHAHHCYYEKNKAPWEYPDHAFTCLCETCHNHVHALQDQLKQQLHGFNIEDYSLLLGYAIAQVFDFRGDMDFHPQSHYVLKGFCDYFGISTLKMSEYLQQNDNRTNYADFQGAKEGLIRER